MKGPSFFEIPLAPYYIVCENYTPKVAGIRALYYLCNALNQLGCEAYIIGATEEVDHLRAPRLKELDILRHLKAGLAPIVIYPEVISGNPLNMPFVVRWLLNKAGHLGGDAEFVESDLVYAYTADYIPEGESLPLLTLPVVNHTIFHNEDNPYDSKREGCCFYAYKYLKNGGQLTHHVEGAVSLCQDVDLTPNEIADILRRSEILYCYEPSAIIREASLCGCPVVIIPSKYLDENLTYLIAGEGIASSTEPEAIQYAKDTVHQAEDNNIEFHGHCWHHLRTFIEVTQDTFSGREQVGWGDEVFDWVDKTNGAEGASKVGVARAKAKGNQMWLAMNALQEGQATIMAEQMHHTWLHQPTFHLIIVLEKNELVHLSDTFESLEQQLYGMWGLSIISLEPQPDIFTDLPDNIEWIQLKSTLNETINQTVAETGLDWIFQLMPGDKLLPQALWSFANRINQYVNERFIYSDEMNNENSPQLLFKPDFNLELLRSSSYIARSAMIRRDTFEKIGGYTGLAYVDVTDLAFQVYESWGELAIGHIDDVLYSAIKINVDAKIVSDNELAVRVAHIARQGINAIVQLLPDDTFKIKYLIETPPLVSVVMANKNNASALVASVNAFYQNTEYENYELLIIDQMSDIEDMSYIFQDFQELFGSKLRLLEFGDANYSAAINYGVTESKGDYILVLSSQMLPANELWMTEMVAIALRDDTGVVGVKVTEDESPHNVIHAGGVLGVSNDVLGLFSDENYDARGYMNRAALAQEYAFVSSAAFIVNKEAFILVGGLDEEELANTHYCITDFCLKIKESGYKNIWTPHAVLHQNLSLSLHNNGFCDYNNEGAEDILLRRWHKYIEHDAAYNRNLSLVEANYTVQIRTPLTWPEENYGKPRIMAFPFSSGAVGEFRVRAPLNYLSDEGVIEACYLSNHENIIAPAVPTKYEVIKAKPDIIYFNNALQDAHYSLLQWLKAETNVYTIFSIDDLIISLPKKNDARRLLHKDIRHRLRRTLALCDRLIVSTQPLADVFSEFCSDIVIVPNSIDMNRWATVIVPKPQKRERLRVGWAGGQLHRGDLDMIVNLVKETAQQVDWIFMGLCPEDLKPYLHEFHEFTSFSEYPEKMAELDLDLAIAPLELHPFNEAKSNLRLLEYGILGWPVICTDIYPYRENNPPVIHVNNTGEEWLAAVRAEISQPEQLKEKGESLRKWVLKHYSLQNKKAEWLSALTLN